MPILPPRFSSTREASKRAPCLFVLFFMVMTSIDRPFGGSFGWLIVHFRKGKKGGRSSARCHHVVGAQGGEREGEEGGGFIVHTVVCLFEWNALRHGWLAGYLLPSKAAKESDAERSEASGL